MHPAIVTSEQKATIITVKQQAAIEQLPHDWQPLIQRTLEKNIKMTIEDVVGIWELPQPQDIKGHTVSIVWLEKGDWKTGFVHIWERHQSEFLKRGITKDEIVEVVTKKMSKGQVAEQGPQ
jgi:hypothetical protein